MDKKTLSFFILFGLIIATTAGWKYYVYVIKKDFQIIGEISCNPTQEKCFARECESEDCESDYEYYKKISKNAQNIKNCSTDDSECNPLFCEIGELNCTITSCDSSTKEEGEQCNNEIENINNDPTETHTINE